MPVSSTAAAEHLVIGAGVVGLACARALQQEGARSVLVIEAEERVAAHQSGHNSGVIHSGLYYRPGSLKARLCTQGRTELLEFCAQHEVPHQVTGKVVVATNQRECQALTELARRGKANGLTGIEHLGPDGIREHEPHAQGMEGLYVPQTGIADFRALAKALARAIEEAGGEVRLTVTAGKLRQENNLWQVETNQGLLRARKLINCGGAWADRIARAAGARPRIRIVPFRGEYHTLAPGAQHLVRNLIYPVPDPRFPFLGVHLTRMIAGGIEAGPNAVLAFSRAGYRWRDVSARDLLETLSFPGSWKLFARHLKTGLGEVQRSLSRAAFAKALKRLVPELEEQDLISAGSGVRAQALGRDGVLVDDFQFEEGPNALHVLSAPSPAATASLAIGREIARRALDLGHNSSP